MHRISPFGFKKLGYSASINQSQSRCAKKFFRPEFLTIESANYRQVSYFLLNAAYNICKETGTVFNTAPIFILSLVGCEVAEVLAEQGKEVTIVRRSLHVATKLPFLALRHYVIGSLIEKGVKFQLGVSYKEVTPRGLTIIDKDGNEQTLEAETIILATGAQSNNKLLFELRGKVPEISAIGDALEPRRIWDAIHEGFKTAYSL